MRRETRIKARALFQRVLEALRLFHVLEDFKAKRRGEIRIAPRGTRGRVYAHVESPGSHNTSKVGLAELEIKVTRANGAVETYNVPATAAPRS